MYQQGIGMPMQNTGGCLGASTNNPSLAGTAQAANEQSERVLGRIRQIIGRMEMQPQGKDGPGVFPEVPLLQKLATIHDNLIQADKFLCELELRIFG